MTSPNRDPSESEATPVQSEFKLRAEWPLENEVPAFFSNQFALYVMPDEAVLVFGSVLATGLAGQSQDHIETYLNGLPIQIGAKIVMTQNGLRALARILVPHVGDAEVKV